MKTRTVAMIATGLLLIAGTTVLSYDLSPRDNDDGPPRILVQPLAPAPTPAFVENSHLRVGLSLDQSVVSLEDRDAMLLVEVIAKEGTITSRTPVSIALVLDASGSMAGNKIQNARQAAHAFIDQLAQGDTVSIISFDTSVTTHLANHLVGAERSAAHQAVDRITPGGGTCVSCGLQSAYSLLSDASSDRLRRVILMSDGHANSGISDLAGLRQLASSASQGLMVSTAAIGLGQDHDESLLSAIAISGSANFYFLHNSGFMASILERELASLARTAIAELSIEVVPSQGVNLLDTANPTVRREGASLVIAVGPIAAGEKRYYLVPMEIPAGDLAEVVRARAFFTPIDGVKQQLDLAVSMERSEDAGRITASINQSVVEQHAVLDSVAQIEAALDAYEAGERDRAFTILQSNAQQVRALSVSLGGSSALEQEAADAAGLMQTLSTAVVPGSREERGNILFNRARSQDVQRGQSREESYHQNGIYDFSITE